MDLKDQKYMAALAGEGSLTKAARRLNLSQPALSRNLACHWSYAPGKA